MLFPIQLPNIKYEITCKYNQNCEVYVLGSFVHSVYFLALRSVYILAFRP